ncbi:sulfite exporter TauE/SafE family protein [Planomonospora sp. ID82291]|uniref:urease accessory protein UreH domain-containing protein n=1 Tax=Planomonospora sp. ID82291 TaxID=2738136 RepID=UPI0018C3E623|nr:sulfite exporter TauE/SafE family protein [Planomonospora sp. ID82291]MBG0813211.1 sulfite exporter TauE/SafE family protein [Planomonospora sp. ID82291]
MSAEVITLFTGGLAAGLAAGTASCTAAQGGLLAGLASGARRSPRGRGTPGEPSGSGGAPGGTSRSRAAPDGTPGGPNPPAGGGPSGTAGGVCRTPAGQSGPKAVALFLAGRLASHVAAGVLLGLVGSAVRLGPPVRAALLVAAGIAVAVFGLQSLVRGSAPCPPVVSALRAGPAPSARRAVLLGAATVLVPCGVTLSTEAVAVSSGSAAGGAAVMAGFAAGTAPAFALLGLVLRRVAATRLAALAGVAALVAGLWTAGSGLRLGGWLPSPGGAVGAAAAASPVRPVGADGVQRIDVWATDRGYRPGIATARAGVPTEISFHLAGTPGCTRSLTVDGRDVALPAVVRLAPRRPGSLRYVCSMGMYVGFITFI